MFCGEQGSSSGLVVDVARGSVCVAAGGPPQAETNNRKRGNKYRKNVFMPGIITKLRDGHGRPSVTGSFREFYFLIRTKMPVFSVVRTL